MALWKTYTSQLYKASRYCATWPVNGKLKIGDIALLGEDRSLDPQKTIAAIGVPIEIRDGNEVIDQGWTTGTTFKLKPSLKAGLPVKPGLKVATGIGVEFTRKHSLLLRMERCREQSLDHQDSLRKKMLSLHEKGEWDPKWVVITHLVFAGRTIALVSERKGASADFLASAHVGADPAAVIDAHGELGLVGSSGMGLQQSGEDFTPLYKALRVKPRHIRGPRIKKINKRGRARPGEEADVVELSF